MTSAATEFLTKQLNIEKEIVTFRWLSRALSIHVNAAKNELASFHASSRATAEPVHAMYLLAGEVSPVKATGSYRDNDQMNVDGEDPETIPVTKIFLVGENELETAKTQFARISSMHVYSLSPSVIRDAALLASTADRVRLEDGLKGEVHNRTVGTVIGSEVKLSRLPNSNVPNATKAVAAATSKVKPAANTKVAENPKSSDKNKLSDNAKAEEKKKGALDWSKAKAKSDKDKEAIAMTKNEKEMTNKGKEVAIKESKTNLKEKDKLSSKDTEKEPPAKPKRGTKRPSAAMSLSDSEDSEQEDDNAAPKAKPRNSNSSIPSKLFGIEKSVRIKKGALISDDEDEDKKKVRPKLASQRGKGRVIVSDEEENRSIRAVMDLDDSQVTGHNQAAPASEHESDDEDVEMLSDPEPVPARPKVKRKPKKKIPIGSNGLPKRRVVKSRKAKNAKGYLVTEDYSSYESVSESEQASLPQHIEKKLQKSKQKLREEGNLPNPTSAKSAGTADDSSSEHSKAKEERSVIKKPGSNSGESKAKSGKNNLMSYFGKK